MAPVEAGVGPPWRRRVLAGGLAAREPRAAARAAAAAEHRSGPTPSSVYGARVDYIWANAAAMRCWRVGRYGHVELGCGKGGQPLTDHALVVCELEPR